jgi:hypothetical protein
VTPLPQDQVGLQTQLTPSVDPTLGSKAAFKAGDLEAGIGPATAWDKYKAAMELAISDAPTGVPGLGADDLINGTWTRAAARWATERQLDAEGRTKISPQEANQKYPGMPKPFNEPIHEEIASLQWSENERKNKYREYIRRGGGLNAAEEMLTGAPTMLDPVNVLAAMATGGAAKALGVGKSVTANLAENAISNLAVDVPTHFMQKAEGQDPSIEATVFGSLGGAMLGTAAHYAGSAMWKKLSRMKDNLPTSLKEEGIRTAVAQVAMGKNVDVEHIVAQNELRRSGVAENVDPRQVGAPLEQGTVFGAHGSDGANIPLSDHGVDGVHVTEHPDVANNVASNPDGLTSGSVVRYKLDENAKLLELDKPASPDLKTSIESKLGPELASKLDITEKTTPNEIMDQLMMLNKKEIDAPKLLQETATDLGYHGFSETAMHEGQPSHQNKTIFDESKLTPIEQTMADKSTTPSLTPDERGAFAEKTLAPESSRHYDQKIVDEIHQLQAEKGSLTSKLEEINKANESLADRSIKASIDEKTKAGSVDAFDEQVKQDLQNIRDEIQMAKDQKEAIDAYSFCETKGGL